MWSPDFSSHPVSAKLFPSLKCSDTDSAVGDVSLNSYEQSHQSQLSDISAMDFQHTDSASNAHSQPVTQCSSNQVRFSLTKGSISSSNLGALISPNIATCSELDSHLTSHRKLSSSNSLNTVSSSANGDISAQNELSLPTPSWCSPSPLLPYSTTPAATSTPQNPVNPRDVAPLPQNVLDLLKTFSPSEPDRLIGRNMGLETVDIVSELYSRGIHSLQIIFNHLEPQDLCRYMCFT